MRVVTTYNNFSIIIPVYNKERYLGRAIDSIAKQDYPSYEIVIADDGSTDGSISSLKQYDKLPIRIFTQVNKGPASARNFGVKNARNDWCIFLDADDELLPNCLQLFNELINTCVGYNVFVGNYYTNRGGANYIYSKDCVSGEVMDNFYSFFKNKLPMRAGSVVFKKFILEKFPQKEDFRRYEDLESLLNIMRSEKIYCNPTPVMVYNVGCATASQRRKSIKEDFLGSISFVGKSFWERAILWSLYEQAKKIYPDEVKTLYDFKLGEQYDVRLYFLCARLISKISSAFRKR